MMWRLPLSEPTSGRWSSRRPSPTCAADTLLSDRRPADGARPRRGRRGNPRHRRLQGPGDFLGGVGLDEVADLDAPDAVDRQAALEAGEHFPHVVLEPLERGDRALPEHGAVAAD